MKKSKEIEEMLYFLSKDPKRMLNKKALVVFAIFDVVILYNLGFSI